MILLTDEEIRGCWPVGNRKGYVPETYDYALVKAQLKKVVEWGDETCNEHTPILNSVFVLRRYCDMCWQSLLDEVKE